MDLADRSRSPNDVRTSVPCEMSGRIEEGAFVWIQIFVLRSESRQGENLYENYKAQESDSSVPVVRNY